jgi:hypothetical protein
MRRRVVSRRRHAPSEDRVGGRDAPRRAPVRGFHVYAVESIRGVLVRGAPLAHHRRPEARARGAKNADTWTKCSEEVPAPPGECAGVSVLPRQTRSLRHPRSGTSTRAACPRNAARRDHEPRDARSKPRRRGDRRAPARCRAPRVRPHGAPGGWPRLQSLGRVGSPRHAVRGVRVGGGVDRQRAGRHPRRLAGRARARRGTHARVSASPHPVVHAFEGLAQAPIRSSSRSKIFALLPCLFSPAPPNGNVQLLSLRAYTYGRGRKLGLTPF